MVLKYYRASKKVLVAYGIGHVLMPMLNSNNNLIIEFVFKSFANFSQKEMKINIL